VFALQRTFEINRILKRLDRGFWIHLLNFTHAVSHLVQCINGCRRDARIEKVGFSVQLPRNDTEQRTRFEKIRGDVVWSHKMKNARQSFLSAGAGKNICITEREKEFARRRYGHDMIEVLSRYP